MVEYVCDQFLPKQMHFNGLKMNKVKSSYVHNIILK